MIEGRNKLKLDKFQVVFFKILEIEKLLHLKDILLIKFK